MGKNFRRMSLTDIKTIISDLDRWAMGQLGSKLTWELLEDRFGFSRQSLQAKPEIKAAYDHAKQALAGGLIISKEQATEENNELRCELERIKLELEAYKRKEYLWKQRWQRIAFHIRGKGIQVQEVDRPIPDGRIEPTERDTTNILKAFDKEIPSSGRV